MVLADQGAAEAIGDHFKNGPGSGGLEIHHGLHLIHSEYLLLDAPQGGGSAHHGEGLVFEPVQTDV